MALCLTELTQSEIQHLGKAIVPLVKPDLSSFPAEIKQGILYESINFLAAYFHRPEGNISVNKALEFYDMIGYCWRKGEVKEKIIQKAKNLEIDLQGLIYQKLGQHNNLLEKAEEILDRPDGSNKDLEKIITLRNLAGKGVEEKDKINLIYKFLFETKKPWRLSQSIYALEGMGKQLEIKSDNITDFIIAYEDEYTHRFDWKKEKNKELWGKINKIVLSFAKTAEDFLDMADIAMQNNCYSMATSFTSSVIKRKGKNTNIDHKLIENAETLLQKGHFGYSKLILEKLGKKFDYQKAYDVLLEDIEKRDFSRSLAISENLGALIRHAPEKDLKEKADKIYALIKRSDPRLNRFEGRSTAYLFALYAYDNLGYSERAFDVAKKGIHRGILCKYWFKDNKILKNLYDMLPNKPLTKKYREERRESKEELKQETALPNLGNILENDGKFLDKVLPAYDKNGVEGVAKLIEGYVKKISSQDVENIYGAHPVDILSHAFPQAKRELTDEDRIKITRYCLNHGFAHCGFDYQALHVVQKDKKLIEKISPEEWALGSTQVLQQDLVSHSEAIEFAELSRSPVPPALYIRQAIGGLARGVKHPIHEKDDWKYGDNVNIFSAYKTFQKANDKGLLDFMNKNFGNLIKEWKSKGHL